MWIRLFLVVILALGTVAAQWETSSRNLAIVIAMAIIACMLSAVAHHGAGRSTTPRDALFVKGQRCRAVVSRSIGKHPWLVALLLFAVMVMATSTPWDRGIPILGTNPWHDCESNLLQARLLLEGRLARPGLENPDFFRTIHVLVTPIYCSKYPLGYPAVMAIGLWLGCVAWLPPGLAGMTVAAVWLLGRRTIGRWCAFLASLILASCPIVIDLGMLHLSSTLTMFLGTVTVGLWMRQIKHGCTRKGGLVIGLLLSATFMARPVDAMALGLTIGATQLVLSGPLTRGVWCWLIAIFIGVVPSIAGTFTHQRLTTGSWMNSPYLIYEHQQSYTGQFIFESVEPSKGLDKMPVSIQRFADEFTAPVHRAHTFRHLPMAICERVAELSRKTGVAMLLLPMMLLPTSIRSRAAKGLLAVSLGYFALHLIYAFNSPRYLSPIYAALAWGMVCSLDSLRPRKLRGLMQLCVISLIAYGAVSEGRRLVTSTVGPDEASRLATLGLDTATRSYRAAVAELPQGRKLVFVRYAPDHRCDREFVYNEPDLQAAICVIAHDLGDQRNHTLLMAYPDRDYYLFDEASGAMARMVP